MKTVVINDKAYSVHFGLSTIKNFALMHNIETVEEFEKKFSTLDDGRIESMELMSELLLAGIERGMRIAGEDCDLDADTILDLSLEDPETFAALTQILGESFNRGNAKQGASAPKKKLKRLPGTK
jgi:cytosine/adenosine deaminase-related metal-dependent hydrolase